MITLRDLAQRAAAEGITDEAVIQNAVQAGELELSDLPRLVEAAGETLQLWWDFNEPVTDEDPESRRVRTQEKMDKALGATPTADQQTMFFALQIMPLLRAMENITMHDITCPDCQDTPQPHPPSRWWQWWRRWF